MSLDSRWVTGALAGRPPRDARRTDRLQCRFSTVRGRRSNGLGSSDVAGRRKFRARSHPDKRMAAQNRGSVPPSGERSDRRRESFSPRARPAPGTGAGSQGAFGFAYPLGVARGLSPSQPGLGLRDLFAHLGQQRVRVGCRAPPGRVHRAPHLVVHDPQPAVEVPRDLPADPAGVVPLGLDVAQLRLGATGIGVDVERLGFGPAARGAGRGSPSAQRRGPRRPRCGARRRSRPGRPGTVPRASVPRPWQPGARSSTPPSAP